MSVLKESKAAKAFQRKLLIAWCIDRHPGNLTHLQKLTGMPRRTLQDAIKDLDDLSIECSFQQTEGALNNQGVYRIDQWGCIDPSWVDQSIESIAESLDIRLQLDY
jgi:hypothetical protein